MNKTEFAELRVMLLSGKTHGAQTLRSVLALAGVTKIISLDQPARALDLLTIDYFDAIFVADGCQLVEGMSFPLAVRRTRGILSPMMPIFVFQEQARRRNVEAARDTGATDFITCPISTRTVMTKLEAALLSPRRFIKAPGYFGPDRRAKARPLWHGEDRRSRAPRKVQLQKGVRPPNPTLL